MKKNKRILIVRPDRIGDVVLSTAIPREIKKSFPDTFIAVLIRKYTEAIYQNNPNVNEIILLESLPSNGLSGFFSSINMIRKHKFTHALMLLPNERINYILFFAGIKTRVGVGRKFYQTITFTNEVNRHKYVPLRHEADYCMDLARAIGVRTQNFTPEIFLSDKDKSKITQQKNMLAENGKFLVGVHCTSGNSAPNLSESEYFNLITQLRKIKNIEVVITDNIISKSFKQFGNLQFINENKSLNEAIANYAALDLLISASTGPMHICSALGVKTISLFCPLTACSPKLWGPLGNENVSMIPFENYCRTQCPGDPKKCSFEGNSGIDSEHILEVVKSLFPF